MALRIPKSTNIFSLLWEYKLIIAMAGLLATIGWQSYSIRGYKIDILELENDLIVADNEVKLCKTKIDENNIKIKEEEEKGKKIQEDLDSVSDELDRIKRENQITIDSLRNETVEDSCEAVEEYLRNNLEKIQW